MKFRLPSALLISVMALITADLVAAPIDFTFGITSGVLYQPYDPSEIQRDGLEITAPFPDYVNKSYTAQIVGQVRINATKPSLRLTAIGISASGQP